MTFFIQSYFVKEALEKFKVVFRDKVPVIEKRSKDEQNSWSKCRKTFFIYMSG